MNVVTINTYGGSLLLGIKNAGEDFRCSLSLEDSGFGVELQRQNFPDLEVLESLFDWPMDIDLSDSLVIAHPPCSGFSRANNSRSDLASGTTSMAFKQTVNVIKYATGRNAAAVIVESVCQACKGGKEVHDKFLEKYDLFRVFQNSAFLGTPQWRPRFWAVYLRKDLGGKLGLRDFDGKIVRANEVIDFKGAGVPGQMKKFNEFREKVADKFPDMDFDKMARGDLGPGAMPQLMDKELGTKTKGLATYISAAPRVVDKNGLVTTLMNNSLWCMNGKMLSQTDFKACMGFPRNYIMPPKDMLMYLSKGVVPQVATWLLRSIADTIQGKDTARWTLEGKNQMFSVNLPKKIFVDRGTLDRDHDIVTGDMSNVLKKTYTGIQDTMRSIIFDLSSLPALKKAQRSPELTELLTRAVAMVAARDIKAPEQEQDTEE